ncbi:hypothetical protein R1sor_012348 [Riccia sorocarpa]|uniref:YDG domain-containing protein n=1 Tax=Riccia sorocarpa TaxID=122646 RepID=A0ABD3I682_9MARC
MSLSFASLLTQRHEVLRFLVSLLENAARRIADPLVELEINPLLFLSGALAHRNQRTMRLKRKRTGEMDFTFDEMNRLKLKSSTSDGYLHSLKDYPDPSPSESAVKSSLHLRWSFVDTQVSEGQSAELLTALNRILNVFSDMELLKDGRSDTACKILDPNTELELNLHEDEDMDPDSWTHNRTENIPTVRAETEDNRQQLILRKEDEISSVFSRGNSCQNKPAARAEIEDNRKQLVLRSKAEMSSVLSPGNACQNIPTARAELEDKREQLVLRGEQEKSSVSSRGNSCEISSNSLLYGEELMFHGTLKQPSTSKIHQVFSVDLRSSRQPFFQNVRVVPKDGTGCAPANPARSKKSYKKWKLGSTDLNLESLPVVDEVFDGPEWKCFDARKRVTTILSQFRYLVNLYRSQQVAQPDVAAGRYLMLKKFCFNEGRSVVGAIPGVEIGDRFIYRKELLILIVCRTGQAGIEYIPASRSPYVDENGCPVSVAVSVVSSGGYKDDEEDGETLIYVGSGGDKNLVLRKVRMCARPEADTVAQDQELVRGNLALKNSCDFDVPVRVIRGGLYFDEELKKKRKGYCYGGLYDVTRYYQDTGSAGSKVWKFHLIKRKEQEVMLFSQNCYASKKPSGRRDTHQDIPV